MKRKKKKKNIFEVSEESREEDQNEEIDELLTKDNNNQENANTLPPKTGTPIASPYVTRGGSIARASITSATNRRATGVRKSLVNTLLRNQTEANTQNITQSQRRSSIKMKATQKSIINSDKSTI